MTGTKIVKLRLDEGAGERLPSLKRHAVAAALGLWETTEYKGWDDSKGFYEKLMWEAKEYRATAKDVQAIADQLEERHSSEDWYPQKAGILLTVMMQNSSESEFTLKTETHLAYVGYRLFGGKKITVEGDVASNVGRHMTEGHIHVKGEAGSNAGHHMMNSTLRIEKDAEGWLGESMGENSSIYVGGKAGGSVGEGMWGGKIEVVGDVGDNAGKRMQKGELIIGGNAGNNLGENMSGGHIHVKGNCGWGTADCIGRGRIDIDGNVKNFGYIGINKEVYHKGKRTKG
ncbi:MAG: hypothetical protein V1921_06280 [Candidatus Altiarchaeota archaeon]